MSTAAAEGAGIERTQRRQGDRFEGRRRELADAALLTLSELGYARTSLREIAQNSAFSHGVLHYYFTDKADLITYCVRQFKEICVQGYDAVIIAAETPEELATGFADGMVATMVHEGSMHRLWYDLRTQSMFEESFRADVLAIDATVGRMIERITNRYAELAGRELATSEGLNYAMFDGIFLHALMQHLAGREDAAATLRAQVLRLLPRLLR